MWPWGHAALGYLVYATYRRARGEPWPASDASTVALAIGTQFPDLIDKPLAWTFAILPSGRSLGHSLLVGTLLIAVVLAVARRYDRRAPAGAFAVGFYAHLLGDALLPLLRLDVEFLTFLAWPLLELPPYENDSSFVAHILNLSPEPFTLFGFALTVFTVGVWIRDGHPGLRWLDREPTAVPSDD